ncbi:MAG: glycosyltransferase family 4 protein [Polyangiaceae bacterium]
MSARVAVISTSYPRDAGDAAGHFVRCEVRALVREGHDVHVLVPGRGSSNAGYPDGARVHWLEDHGAFGWPGALTRLAQHPTRSLGACAFTLRAARALHTLGPFASVQAHFLVPSGWPIAMASSAPLEVVGHGSDVRLFCRLPSALRKHIARRWLHRAARVRVTSSELAALLREACPELGARLEVRPSPLDVSGVPTRAEARRSLAIPECARVGLVVSRLIAGKRVDVALRALSLLEEISVSVVGDGPELESLRAQFPAVHFAGRLPRPEALRFMAAADVVVSASVEEGAPSVVREARALGVPVVAVAAGDLASWAERDPGLLLVRR